MEGDNEDFQKTKQKKNTCYRLPSLVSTILGVHNCAIDAKNKNLINPKISTHKISTAKTQTPHTLSKLFQLEVKQSIPSDRWEALSLSQTSSNRIYEYQSMLAIALHYVR